MRDNVKGVYTDMYIGISYTNVKKMMDLGYAEWVENGHKRKSMYREIIELFETHY
jgi:hypothetical protein